MLPSGLSNGPWFCGTAIDGLDALFAAAVASVRMFAAMLFPAMTSVIPESRSRRSHCSKPGRWSRAIRRPIFSSLKSRPLPDHLPRYESGAAFHRHAHWSGFIRVIVSFDSGLPVHSRHDPPAYDGIQREHAPPVTDGRVKILLDGLVEVEQGVDVIELAPFTLHPKLVRFRLYLRRVGNGLLSKFLHFLKRNLVFDHCLLDVDFGLSFHVRKLDLRLVHVEPGSLDSPLIAVIDRQRNSHAQRPRVLALQPVRGVVLKRIRLPEHIHVAEGVRPRQPNVGFGPENAESKCQNVGTFIRCQFREDLARWWRRGYVLDRSREARVKQSLRAVSSSTTPDPFSPCGRMPPRRPGRAVLSGT